MADFKKFYTRFIRSPATIYLCEQLNSYFYCMNALPCLHITSDTTAKISMVANFKTPVEDLRHHLIIFENDTYSLIDMRELDSITDMGNKKHLDTLVHNNFTNLLTGKCSLILNLNGLLLSVSIESRT
jgi:hypothetical protein